MVFVSILGNVLTPFSDDYLREKCQSLYNWILVQFALTHIDSHLSTSLVVTILHWGLMIGPTLVNRMGEEFWNREFGTHS